MAAAGGVRKFLGASEALAKWTGPDFKAFLARYDIRSEWDPRLPSPTQTVLNPPEGMIALYADFFRFCHFRVPVSKFCLHILEFYQLHISQIHPLGLVKLRHFEFVMRSLMKRPDPLLFNAFFLVTKKGDWYTFDKRDSSKNMIGAFPGSSQNKRWKHKFFYIDACAIPGNMVFRHRGEAINDIPPSPQVVGSSFYKWLCSHPSPIQTISEHALVICGMSRSWARRGFKPSYAYSGGGEFSLYELMLDGNKDFFTPTEVELFGNDREILDLTQDCFVYPDFSGKFDPRTSLTRPLLVAGASISVFMDDNYTPNVEGAGEVVMSDDEVDAIEANASSRGVVPTAPSLERAPILNVVPPGKSAASKRKVSDSSAEPSDSKKMKQLAEFQRRRFVGSNAHGVGSSTSSQDSRSEGLWKQSRGEAQLLGSDRVGVASVPKRRSVGFSDVSSSKARAPGSCGAPLSGVGKLAESIVPMLSPPLPPSGSSVSTGLRYPLEVNLDGVQGDAPFIPNWQLAQNARLSSPDVCRQWLVNSVPPGEKAVIQRKENFEISDEVAKALTTLIGHYPEICRRADYDSRMYSAAMVERSKLTEELVKIQKGVGSSNVEPSKVEDWRGKLISAEESFGVERELKQGLRVKLPNPSKARVMGSGSHSELRSQLDKALKDVADLQGTLSSTVSEKDRVIGGHVVELETARADLKAIRESLEIKERLLNEKASLINSLESASKASESAFSSKISALEATIKTLQLDREWLVKSGFSEFLKRLREDPQYVDLLHSLTTAADFVGRQDGMRVGHQIGLNKMPLTGHPDLAANSLSDLADAYDAFDTMVPHILLSLQDVPLNDDLSLVRGVLTSPYTTSIGHASVEDDDSDGASDGDAEET
ncbi:hypothetical protein QVD17_18627 [Tagetes erecta]|uniref:Transposase (Putative), gypsy type n=1 Tax=Tagetes erecta TaxID=13708 RepID=A0AAD8KI61_TARER|nr:hypothetical protein QVD17_18627 [Tagetes erecta]